MHMRQVLQLPTDSLEFGTTIGRPTKQNQHNLGTCT